MNRKLIAFTMSLALLLSVLLVANVGAHSVTVDNTRQEWFGVEASGPGTGIIRRNTANQGEFVYNDETHDQRVIDANNVISRSVDLDWFSTTADASNIYFLAKVERIAGVTQNPSVELMISIDSDHSSNTNIALPDGVGINVTSEAEWEDVIQTRFTPANAAAPPRMFKNKSSSPSSCTSCEARLAGASNGGFPGSFIEIKVPWSNITGGKPSPDKFLRFTVSTYLSGHPVPSDSLPSAMLDALGTQSTANDVADSDIDTFFDLHFDANGEVFAPLQVTEFLANPLGNDSTSSQGSEWIEIYNPTTFSVNLSEYKIGNAAKRGGSSEGMFKFPNGSTIAAGAFVVVAKDKTKFNAIYPGVSATVYGLNQLSVYSPWSTGATIGLSNTGEDQVLLLDGRDTIVDIVNYATTNALPPTYPGLVPISVPETGVPESNSYSYERCPANRDTDDNSFDFQAHDGSPTAGAPTPGATCPPTTGVDLSIIKTAAASQVGAGATVTYYLNWSNVGTASLTSVVVTDTLPAQITFSSSAPLPPTSQSGQTQTWNLGPVAHGASGTIIVTGTVSGSAPVNFPLVNTAGIQSGNPLQVESSANLGDNASSASVTVIRPNLSVDSTWPTGGVINSDITYIISYRNNGDAIADPVTVSSTVPNGVTFLSSTPSPSSVGPGTTRNWEIGSLGPGEGGTITVRVHINNTVTKGTHLDSTVTITGVPADDPTTLADNTRTRTLIAGQFTIDMPLILK